MELGRNAQLHIVILGIKVFQRQHLNMKGGASRCN
nr:MAG TPA: hypothetical protein [Caudoviricetes sp.]